MSGGSEKPELLPLKFANVELGMTFGPVELEITERLAKAFAFSTDDYSGICGGGEETTAAILLADMVKLLNYRFDPNSMLGLHAKEQYEVHSKVQIGETVVMEGSCVERYVRRGKGYYVIEATARSKADDRLILTHRSTELAEIDAVFEDTPPGNSPGSRRVEAEVDPSLAVAAVAAPGLPPGTPVPALMKEMHQEQIAVYSNVGLHWKNIHTDLDVAKKAGYDRTLAQGLMQSVYAAQVGARFFGEAWHATGFSDLTYLNPVFEGDVLTLSGAVATSEETEGGIRIELAVWTENQRGERTAAGSLSGIVAAAG